MTGNEPKIVDSNILIYAYDSAEGKKHEKAIKAVEEILLSGNGVLSIQNLVEFYSVITQKVSKPVSQENAKQIVLDLCEGFEIIKYNEKTIIEATNIGMAHKVPFWDALLAATMQENKVYTIITENEGHFKKISWIKTINPLK